MSQFRGFTSILLQGNKIYKKNVSSTFNRVHWRIQEGGGYLFTGPRNNLIICTQEVNARKSTMRISVPTVHPPKETKYSLDSLLRATGFFSQEPESQPSASSDSNSTCSGQVSL